ncbi:hypothetical protein BSFP_016540 [Burkholderia stabilis]|uniref:Uncharacterized protein n=1 Tax=Burkholderia stabilis TaxID=95485 RepID=A0A1Y1BG94_9BURK|nr:hypothetical protein BSFP_016540 [Burkholderia stabilis]
MGDGWRCLAPPRAIALRMRMIFANRPTDRRTNADDFGL